MKKLLKVVLIFFGLGVGLAAISVGVGAILPKEHSYTRTVKLKQPPEAVWEALTTFSKHTEFRPELASATKLVNEGQNEVWVETYKNGQSMTFETTEFEFGKKLTRTIADKDPMVKGGWTFTLDPTEDGTQLSLAENASVENPFFRFMCRVVFRTKYMDQFLTEISSKFGETPEIL